MSKHLSMDVRVPIEEGNPAIRRIGKSLYQMRTVLTYVVKQISVGHHYDL